MKELNRFTVVTDTHADGTVEAKMEVDYFGDYVSYYEHRKAVTEAWIEACRMRDAGTEAVLRAKHEEIKSLKEYIKQLTVLLEEANQVMP